MDPVPVAFVVLQPHPREPTWRVCRCPFCGEAHSHGAGVPGEDPALSLGLRLSHCFAGGRQYCLVQLPADMAPPVPQRRRRRWRRSSA